MKKLLLIAWLALGASGCADFEVYSPASGKTPSQWASEHFARAGQEFAQAGQAIAQVVDQAAPAFADAAAAYYAGRANSYAARTRYELEQPLPRIDTGTSGTIIGPEGMSFYHLDAHGSGTVIGPEGMTFIH
jgi:hypothetical protein